MRDALEHVTREFDGDGLHSHLDLLEDQGVEGAAKLMENPKQKNGLHQGTIFF